MNICLLKALRIVIRADSDPARQTLFRRYLEGHPLARLAHGLHQRLDGRRAAWLAGTYGLAAFVSIEGPRHDARVLVAAVHANARRQVRWACDGIGASLCGWVRAERQAGLGPAGLKRAWALVTGRRRRSLLALLDVVGRRHGFLVASRVACALAWYARCRALLAARRPGAVLVSSDSNPEEVGLVAAARRLGVPQVFVSHAFPTPYSPPLDFSLSVLEGTAALEARRRAGAERGAVLIAGVEGDSRPLRPERLLTPGPSVGIFPPKAVSWETLRQIVLACRDRLGARRLVFRWHPSMLEPPRLARLGATGLDCVETSPAVSLVEVAEQCDWVVADENSNVHLQVLRLGIPTIAVHHLGLYPPSHRDMYGFIANRITVPSRAALSDVDLEATCRFYDASWRERFARYDGGYLRPRDEVGREVGQAVRALFEPVTLAGSPAQ